jgi:hypothetical protein
MELTVPAMGSETTGGNIAECEQTIVVTGVSRSVLCRHQIGNNDEDTPDGSRNTR